MTALLARRPLVEFSIFQGGIAILILSRKPSEVIKIGDDISVMVVRIGPNSVRIGISAPKHINIVRGELAGNRQAGVDYDPAHPEGTNYA